MSECLRNENTEIAEVQMLSLLSGKIADVTEVTTEEIEVECQLADGCAGKCTRIFAKNAKRQTIRFNVKDDNKICALV